MRARRVDKVGELRVAQSSERFGHRRQRADAIARAILVAGLDKVALALAGHARHLLAPVGAVMAGGAQALLRQLCRPLKALGAADLRLGDSSIGMSLESQSRGLSVNDSSLVRGWTSKPTVLRTPRATTSMPLPSALMGKIGA